MARTVRVKKHTRYDGVVVPAHTRTLTGGLSPSAIKAIERKAKKLMRGEWNGELLDMLYYHILEDANFHTENSRLVEKGAFGPKERHVAPIGGRVFYTPRDYSQASSKRFEEYKRLGGKSWEL